MPTGINRFRIRASDGNWYWYNPNTRRLFRSERGDDEVTNFTYESGLLTITQPSTFGGSRGPRNPSTPSGPPSYGGPRDPGGRNPSSPYVPRDPDDPDPRNPDDPDEEEPPFPDPCPPGWHMDYDTGSCVRDEDEEEEDDDNDSDDDGIPDSGENAYDALMAWLSEWGLEGLGDFVRQAIIEGKSQSQVLLELRQTEQYKAAFPEQALRQANGFSFMPEAQIFAYRNEARRISALYGINADSMGIANLIGKNISLAEWERRLDTWERFKAWGPTVRSVLEEELGRRITDDEAFAFLANDIPTPELDKAYEDALYRGRPALLGLGVRPDEEAELLRRYGIDVNQAFRGYQSLVNEMPAAERFAALEDQVNQGVQAGNLPNSGSALFNDTPFSLLFRAIQLQDGSAIRLLQEQMSREVARFKVGGGAAFAGTQAVGLQTKAQRESA